MTLKKVIENQAIRNLIKTWFKQMSTEGQLSILLGEGKITKEKRNLIKKGDLLFTWRISFSDLEFENNENDFNIKINDIESNLDFQASATSLTFKNKEYENPIIQFFSAEDEKFFECTVSKDLSSILVSKPDLDFNKNIRLLTDEEIERFPLSNACKNLLKSYRDVLSIQNRDIPIKNILSKEDISSDMTYHSEEILNVENIIEISEESENQINLE